MWTMLICLNELDIVVTIKPSQTDATEFCDTLNMGMAAGCGVEFKLS